MSWVVGVDVGGTFTDFCLFNRATNEVVVHKVPSTPEDPSRAILEGLATAKRISTCPSPTIWPNKTSG
jgi:N-methylhydantoinase A